jgi:UDP-N-acetylmuramate--alanine ligase
MAVITNVDNDHLDHYGTMAKLKEAFVKFANKVPFYGCAVLCADDPYAASLRPKVSRRVVTYGIDQDADIQGEFLEEDLGKFKFQVRAFGKPVGAVQLKVAGRHNVLNALAAVAVGLELELEFSKIAAALAGFTGVTRRLEVLGDLRGIQVIDDYAHHPTEIAATVAAVKGMTRHRLLAVFQPHRFTRTLRLAREFGPAFRGVDRLWITDIYPAGEAPLDGVSAQLILDGVVEEGEVPAEWQPSREQVLNALRTEARPGDIVLVMGAGDIRKLGEALVEGWRK